MTDREMEQRATLRRKVIRYLDTGDDAHAFEALRTLMPMSEEEKQEEEDYEEEPVMFLKRRTRFFISLAKEHNIRLSALVLLVVAHTDYRFYRGKRGRDCLWHQTADWYARRLAVSTKQVYRLIDRAERANLIATERTSHGLNIWVRKKELYTEFRAHKNGEDRRTLGFFNLKLSGLMGLNGSMVYQLLKKPDEDNERREVSPARVAKSLPWMTEEEARKQLEQLWQRGLIQRKRSEFKSHTGQLGYRYYWRARTQEDRRKWQTFSNRIQFFVPDYPTGENVHSLEKMSTRWK